MKIVKGNTKRERESGVNLLDLSRFLHLRNDGFGDEIEVRDVRRRAMVTTRLHLIQVQLVSSDDGIDKVRFVDALAW